jgi:hypothetical protein
MHASSLNRLLRNSLLMVGTCTAAARASARSRRTDGHGTAHGDHHERSLTATAHAAAVLNFYTKRFV